MSNPKVRRFFKIRPVTKIKDSVKIYDRSGYDYDRDLEASYGLENELLDGKYDE